MTFYLGLDESHARVICFGESANGFGKSAGNLHFYRKEIPWICHGAHCFPRPDGTGRSEEEW